MTADMEYIKRVNGDRHKSDNAGVINVMLDENGQMPTRAHEHDAGADIYATHDCMLWPHSHETVDSEVHVQLKPGTVGLLTGRSSMAKRGITVALGIIDSGYTGPLGIVLMNNSDIKVEIKAGERIAQLLILPCDTPGFVQVDSLEETERGDGGFGSTGK